MKILLKLPREGCEIEAQITMLKKRLLLDPNLDGEKIVEILITCTSSGIKILSSLQLKGFMIYV